MALHFSEDEPWMLRGRCRSADPEIFFNDSSDATITRMARRICMMCEVQPECYEYAKGNGLKHGVWGGHNFAAIAKSQGGERAESSRWASLTAALGADSIDVSP